MPRRWVYCFQPRFADLVASGVKRQTIRGERKDGLSPALGDVLSLRAWLGRPRASKQRLLRPECPCVAIFGVIIDDKFGMNLYDGEAGFATDADQIARADGFGSFIEMKMWFREQHGLPFRGVLIQW